MNVKSKSELDIGGHETCPSLSFFPSQGHNSVNIGPFLETREQELSFGTLGFSNWIKNAMGNHPFRKSLSL